MAKKICQRQVEPKLQTKNFSILTIKKINYDDRQTHFVLANTYKILRHFSSSITPKF